ncbi:MAG: CapA family protein, partial [Nitrospinaceae bacterium]|nr:CapA family protein [Nitrospinaceae bacterium]
MATSKPKSTTFVAGGDVAINRTKGPGALGALAPVFKKAGVAFVNLELPLSRRGKGQPDKILLRGTPEMADALTEAGLDTVSLANNHMFDYGEDAFVDTLALLKKIDLPHTGAGMNLTAARRPSILERGGLKIGILGFSSILPRGFAAEQSRPGLNAIRANTAYEVWRDVNEYPGTAPRIVTWTNPGDLARMRRDISALKKRVDVVIINHHWGTSMLHGHQDYQTELGRASIDAGADLVLGGHA